MAGWASILGNPDAFEGLPLPASPITASGQDPDELRSQMAAIAAQHQQQPQGTPSRPGGGGTPQSSVPLLAPARSAQPAQKPAAAPAQGTVPTTSGPMTEFEPAGFNADVARQSMTGQLTAGQRLQGTADEMTPDPQIAQLQNRVMQDQAQAPDPTKYKPGFGTRLLRGLKGAGLGLAEGGIFGMGAGAIDPGLVRGGTPYGAPTDAYDLALNRNKQQVASDNEALANATTNFQEAQKLREARQKALNESGGVFDKAGSTATTQEGEENKAAQLPIDQQKANNDAQKVFNEGPDGKLQITQGQIDSRTRLADAQNMPPGLLRTRFILTGEMQPAHDPSGEEIAVNRILRTWPQEHGGKGPQTVADWQQVYAAAKGGTGSAGGAADKNLREAASIAARRVKDLEAVMGSKGAVLWSPEEKAQHQKDLDDAKAEADSYQRQLTAPAAAPAPALTAPAAAAGAPRGAGSPLASPGNMVRMKLPDGRFAQVPKANVARAIALGATEASAQ